MNVTEHMLMYANLLPTPVHLPMCCQTNEPKVNWLISYTGSSESVQKGNVSATTWGDFPSLSFSHCVRHTTQVRPTWPPPVYTAMQATKHEHYPAQLLQMMRTKNQNKSQRIKTPPFKRDLLTPHEFLKPDLPRQRQLAFLCGSRPNNISLGPLLNRGSAWTCDRSDQ